MTRNSPRTTPAPVLEPGDTCWRIEAAGRFAVIIDAADYFKAVKAAMLKARHTVMMVGWDFDTRIQFEPMGKTLEGPNSLGRFLTWFGRSRRDVQVHVLKWDLGMIQTLGRGATPAFVLDWMTSRNIHLKLDGAHPPGAAHHQKIVVIDDTIAFCGGIDMTRDRWDTRDHDKDNPYRKPPNGRREIPWHDAIAALDGSAARALGDLTRERWRFATGQTLTPPPHGSDCWPDGLEPTFIDADVAIARTWPELDERREIREIEAFYLSAVSAARRHLYIESQYLASRTIAEALAARLREPEGPEIVVILPESSDGWLEEATMDSARNRLLRLIRSADRYGRFGVFHPVNAAGTPIYVHAKITIVDDWLFRIGSSNLNNRSMGFDTECDLAIEADPGSEADAARRARIRGLRDDLLAEHLGLEPQRVSHAIEAAGSLLTMIRQHNGEGRGLVELHAEDNSPLEETLAETDLLDPERATTDRSLLERLRNLLPGRVAWQTN